MEDKLRQELLDGLNRMGEMIEDLRSTAKRTEEPTQPEPQAGDVWMYDNNSCIFVYRDAQLGLRYIWSSGLQINRSAQDKLRDYPATRMFSFAEHLKNKEAANV